MDCPNPLGSRPCRRRDAPPGASRLPVGTLGVADAGRKAREVENAGITICLDFLRLVHWVERRGPRPFPRGIESRVTSP